MTMYGIHCASKIKFNPSDLAHAVSVVGMINPDEQLSRAAHRMAQIVVNTGSTLVTDTTVGVNHAAFYGAMKGESNNPARPKCVLLIREDLYYNERKVERGEIRSKITNAHNHGVVITLSPALFSDPGVPVIPIMKAALSGEIYVMSHANNILGSARTVVSYANLFNRMVRVFGADGLSKPVNPRIVGVAEFPKGRVGEALRRIIWELTRREV